MSRPNVVWLPAYAPELNPAEGVRSYLKRTTLVHLAARGIDEVHRAVKHGLKRMQFRPELLVGFLTETGLTWEQLRSTELHTLSISTARLDPARDVDVIPVMSGSARCRRAIRDRVPAATSPRGSDHGSCSDPAACTWAPGLTTRPTCGCTREHRGWRCDETASIHDFSTVATLDSAPATEVVLAASLITEVQRTNLPDALQGPAVLRAPSHI